MQVVAVEPPAGELVQGLRNLDDGFVPPIFDPDVLDRKFIVRPARVDRVAAAPARRVRRVRRDLVGRGGRRRGEDGGARWSRARSSPCCPTAGWKYLSSGAWTDDLDEVVERATPHQLLVTPDAAPTDAEIARAVDVLRGGGLVAFPTETVYGLGADASSPDAVHRLYAVKGRPADHPVIVHLGDAAQLDEWAADVPDVGARAGARRAGPARSPSCVRRAPTRARRGDRRASTPSGCACPTSRSRSRCCARSAAASRRRRPTGSGG